MLGNDVFIAFSNKKTALSIAKTVLGGGYNVAAAVLNASDLIHKINFYESGIIICGCRFGDGNINTLSASIPDSFRIISIGTHEQLQYCDESRMLTLSVPLNSAALLAYIDMLRVETRSRRSPDEEALINRAKRYLIAYKGMTEPQAHKFLEKKSMDSGRTITEIAKAVLR